MSVWDKVVRAWTFLTIGLTVCFFFFEIDIRFMGVMVLLSSFLSFYAAFFTDNSYTFTWLPPTIKYSWRGLFEKNLNKAINITGAIIWLFVGLILLRLT